ncbi:hypothetical protein DPV78_004636, partial [Talaromyces pinophilus]
GVSNFYKAANGPKSIDLFHFCCKLYQFVLYTNFTLLNMTEIAQVLDQEHVPGTVHLLDLQGRLNVQHAARDHEIILDPAPSNDPDDPLIWATWRKYLCVFCMALQVLLTGILSVTGICSSMLYSTLATFSEQRRLSVDQINTGTGYMFLTFGWGCVILQALALQFGKRPVYLASLLGTMAMMLWQAYITENGQWIAAKLLQGFFGAPIESLAVITVSDVVCIFKHCKRNFFTHERGLHMAIYAVALAWSNNLAPLIMGFINDGQSLEWTFDLCAIFCAVTFVFCFFFMEETNFSRPNVTLAQNEVSETLPALPEGDSKNVSTIQHDEHSGRATAYEPKPYWAKVMSLGQNGFKHKNQIWNLMIQPIKSLTFPVVFYAGFSYGTTVIWLAMMNATESVVFSGGTIWFQYISHWTDISLSVNRKYLVVSIPPWDVALYTGSFGDWLALRLGRRNKGVLEAEHRLWLYSAALLGLPFGYLLWGIGATHNMHWFGLVFAIGIVSFITTSGSQIFVTYLIDSYRALSGEALVTVILVRNMMGFAFGYGVTPWVENMGLQNAFITAAGLTIAHTVSVGLLIKCGKSLRRRSRDKYEKYLQHKDTEDSSY